LKATPGASPSEILEVPFASLGMRLRKRVRGEDVEYILRLLQVADLDVEEAQRGGITLIEIDRLPVKLRILDHTGCLLARCATKPTKDVGRNNPLMSRPRWA